MTRTPIPDYRLRSEAAAWDNSGTTKKALSQRELTQGDDHSQLRTSDRVDIVPPAADIAQHPFDIERMSRVDGCPECVINAEPPKSVAPLADGFRAAYLCGGCGHAWTTDWKD